MLACGGSRADAGDPQYAARRENGAVSEGPISQCAISKTRRHAECVASQREPVGRDCEQRESGAKLRRGTLYRRARRSRTTASPASNESETPLEYHSTFDLANLREKISRPQAASNSNGSCKLRRLFARTTNVAESLLLAIDTHDRPNGEKSLAQEVREGAQTGGHSKRRSAGDAKYSMLRAMERRRACSSMSKTSPRAVANVSVDETVHVVPRRCVDVRDVSLGRDHFDFNLCAANAPIRWSGSLNLCRSHH